MSIGRVPGATGIQPSIVTAKGDLIVATASGSVINQAVGSNNQVLMADSAQADGVKWANEATSTLTTTGDILYASAANTLARRAIGSTGDVLTVSGGLPTWAAPSGYSWTSVASGNFPTNSNTVTISSLSGKNYFIVFNGPTFNTTNNRMILRFNSDTGNNYYNPDSAVANSSIVCYSAANTSALYNAIFIPTANTSSALKAVFSAGVPTTVTVTYGGVWKSTSAITSITLFSSSGTNFSGGSYEIWSNQ